MKSTRSQVIILMVGAGAIVIGIMHETIVRTPRGNESSLSLYHAANIRELVESSEEILLGTVVSSEFLGQSQMGYVTTTPGVYEFHVYATTTPPAFIPTVTPMGVMIQPTWRPFSVTQFEVRVDEVYYSTSGLSVNQLVVMNQLGDINSYVTPTPGNPEDPNDERVRTTLVMSQVGDHRLFFLMKEADDSTYGAHEGPYSVLDISGEYTTIASPPPIIIDITQDPRTASLLGEIEDAIAALPSATPTP